jgi:hypothetical protein
MMVAMRGVTIQHGMQVPLADDEHPAGCLCPDGADPASGMTIR